MYVISSFLCLIPALLNIPLPRFFVSFVLYFISYLRDLSVIVFSVRFHVCGVMVLCMSFVVRLTRVCSCGLRRELHSLRFCV